MESLRLQYIAGAKPAAKALHAHHRDDGESFYYKHLHFSGDGTSIIAHSNQHTLDTYVLPSDLLDDQSQPKELSVHSHGTSPSSLLSVSVHPAFSLSEASTTWVASSHVDLPIQMRNALDYEYATIAYPWKSPTTERYHSANSLAFVAKGSHFAAGSSGRIAVFDASRPNETPVTVHSKSGRGTPYSEGLQDAGLVMALAESASGMLAAGTSTRSVVLFPASGLGQAQVHFKLPSSSSGTRDPCKGCGITSLIWSPCERYLAIAERQSNSCQVFDIRNGGDRMAWLSGRDAMSTQRFDLETIQTGDGVEVWSGGMDGHLKMWKDIGSISGEHAPTADIPVANQPIGSARWHHTGAVLATCAGGRRPSWYNDAAEIDGEYDSAASTQAGHPTRQSLTIWSVG